MLNPQLNHELTDRYGNGNKILCYKKHFNHNSSLCSLLVSSHLVFNIMQFQSNYLFQLLTTIVQIMIKFDDNFGIVHYVNLNCTLVLSFYDVILLGTTFLIFSLRKYVFLFLDQKLDAQRFRNQRHDFCNQSLITSRKTYFRVCHTDLSMKHFCREKCS